MGIVYDTINIYSLHMPSTGRSDSGLASTSTKVLGHIAVGHITDIEARCISFAHQISLFTWRSIYDIITKRKIGISMVASLVICEVSQSDLHS